MNGKKGGEKDIKASGGKGLREMSWTKDREAWDDQAQQIDENSLQGVSKKKSRTHNTVQSSNIFENQFDS